MLGTTLSVGEAGERESVAVPISTAFSFSFSLSPAQSGQASRWREEGKGKGTINNCIRIYDVLYGEEEKQGGGDPWLNGQSPFSLPPSFTVRGPLSLFLFSLSFLPVSQSETHFHFCP